MLISNALIAALEERLIQQGNSEGSADFADDETVADEVSNDGQNHQPCGTCSPEIEAFSPDEFPEFKIAHSSISLPEACVSDLMHAELYVYQKIRSIIQQESEEVLL